MDASSLISPTATASSHAQSPDLLRRLAELERTNARLEECAQLAAHDLQEPLATIALFAGALKSEYAGELDPRALYLLTGVEEGVARMRATVDGALASAEGRTTRSAVVDMNRVVEESLRALVGRREQAASIVQVHSLPPVHGDQAELVRLMQNLIGNALKFSAGSARAQIWLSASSADGVATFALRDNGPGFSPQRASRRGRFQRGRPSDQRAGRGFGLRIARQIVEDHGGRLSIRPSPRGGTIVTFTLSCVWPDAGGLEQPDRQHAS